MSFDPRAGHRFGHLTQEKDRKNNQPEFRDTPLIRRLPRAFLDQRNKHPADFQRLSQRVSGRKMGGGGGGGFGGRPARYFLCAKRPDLRGDGVSSAPGAGPPPTRPCRSRSPPRARSRWRPGGRRPPPPGWSFGTASDAVASRPVARRACSEKGWGWGNTAEGVPLRVWIRFCVCVAFFGCSTQTLSSAAGGLGSPGVVGVDLGLWMRLCVFAEGHGGPPSHCIFSEALNQYSKPKQKG